MPSLIDLKRFSAAALVLAAMAGCVTTHRTRSAAASPEPLRFAIVSDRTGGHRPGVFERAVDKLNLLAPDFVICVGDLIEGYTTDTAEIDRQWAEFTGFSDTLEPPFRYVPGNHDLANQELNDAWRARFGDTYYSFVHANCLFLCLNTEDPSGGHLSPAQLKTMAGALDQHPDVRWTFVFMHQPLWTYTHDTGWDEMERLLASRPHTVFAGHMHQYLRELRNGVEYIMLGTTGGGGPMRGVNYGEVDHVTWVTVDDGAPHIAHLELDGIWDTEMFTPEFEATFAPVIAQRPLVAMPVLWSGRTFTEADATLQLHNDSPYRLTLTAYVDNPAEGLSISPAFFQTTLAPDEVQSRSLSLKFTAPLQVEAVPASALTWQASYAVPARPPIDITGAAPVLVLPEALQYSNPQLPPGATAQMVVEALARAGHDDLAKAAVELYAAHTRNTPEALALIAEARRIGYAGPLLTPLGFVDAWAIGTPAPWHFDHGLQSALPAGLDSIATASCTHAHPDNGVINLLDAAGTLRDSTVFARTTIQAHESGDAVVHLRSDDGIALWLNGTRVHAHNVIRGVTMAEDHVPVRLQSGENTLVVEVTQGIEGWGFSVRVTRPDGTPYPFVQNP